jgi:F-type H+-transporting ATPase subunit epsilon
MADTKQTGGVRCVIVTPEQTSLDTQARSVTLPLFDGLRGVGEVRIIGEQGSPGDGVRRLFVEGGFVEVSHDLVTVITQRAVPAEKLDPTTARAELDAVSTARATGDEAIDAKLEATEAARALVRTATRGRQ